MNKNKLLERQKFVPGKPLPNRVSGSVFSRRTGNYIVMEDSSDEVLDKSFFDFEDELSGMKPAAEQFAETFSKAEDLPIFMEEREEILENNLSSIEQETRIFLEEIDEQDIQIQEEKISTPEILLLKQENTIIYDNEIKNFEFIQCSHVKEDGNRCKRQAPKGNTICSSHQRMLEKQSK